MSKAVGVEINESKVKVVSVESTSKQTKILAFHEEMIPADPAKAWEDQAVEALKKAFEISRVSRGKVVASIDSGDAILRDVSLPFREDDKIRKTVNAELESLIHNFSIEDLVVDYFKTGETEKGTILMAAAIPKAVVEKRLQLLTRGGIDPVALDLDVAALFNTMLQVGAIETDEPQLILYGTPKYTKILLLEKKRPTSIRTIRFSMPSSESLQKEKEERKKAAQWETREVPGGVPILVLSPTEHAKFSELDAETQGSLVGILAKEISRFLLANAASASPTQILLTGEYENEEAAHLLEASTRIPVKTYNLLDVIDHPFTRPLPEQSAKLAVPLGLALKGCDVDALGMDFRKERFSYGKKFETIKTTVLVTLELLVVLFATVALHFYFQQQNYRFLEKQVLVYQNDILEQMSGERAADPMEAFPRFKEYHNRVMQDLGVEHPLPHSALDLWRQIAVAAEAFQRKHAAKPAAQLGGTDLYLLIEDIDILQGTTGGDSLTIRIKGLAANLQQLDYFKSELAANPVFSTVDYEGANPEVDGKRQFSLLVRKGRR